MIYSNVSTSNMDIIFFYFSITEGFFLFTTNFIIALFIITNKDLNCQKEFIIFAGPMIYDACFGLGYISSGIFRMSIYYNENFIPLFTPWMCINLIQNYFWIITIPATGLMVLFCTFDRVISVTFPLRYIGFSLRYAYALVFAPLSIMIPIFIIGAFQAFTMKDQYIVPAMCNFVNGDIPGIFYSLRFVRMFSSIIAILLYIPIMVKIFYINSRSKLHIHQKKKLLRSTITIGLLVSNELFFCVLPDAYLYLNPRWSLIYIVYIMILNKGVINILVTLAIQREIRTTFLKIIKKRYNHVQSFLLFNRSTIAISH